MGSTVDIRISTSIAAYPSEGIFKRCVISRKIDVPALIAAGTLTASGLINTNTYTLINIPQYCIVLGAYIFVRTVDTGGGTITVNTSGSKTLCTTLALSGLGTIIDSSGAGWTIANILAYNTGAGTDYASILIGTANVTTAIFDVCLDTLHADQPYNAGTPAGTTGQ